MLPTTFYGNQKQPLNDKSWLRMPRQYYAETGECACDAIAQNLVWVPQMVVSFVREMVPKMAEATRLKIC